MPRTGKKHFYPHLVPEEYWLDWPLYRSFPISLCLFLTGLGPNVIIGLATLPAAAKKGAAKEALLLMRPMVGPYDAFVTPISAERFQKHG